MGRTGKLWGFENLGVEPDVFTTAKALGGGLPIGAMLCKEHCDVFAPGDHASTFGGNPLCCAAATVVTSRLDKGLLDAVQARSRQLHKGLQALATKHSDVIEGYRGWGLLCGLVFREDCPLVASVVAGKAVEQGLLLVPAGPKVLRFVPPLVIMPSDVEAALERADKAIQAAKASLP
jgi:acetylornithine/N-succinyldiaminopimelate aminotransferase